jgi:hypothetical protein
MPWFPSTPIREMPYGTAEAVPLSKTEFYAGCFFRSLLKAVPFKMGTYSEIS